MMSLIILEHRLHFVSIDSHQDHAAPPSRTWRLANPLQLLAPDSAPCKSPLDRHAVEGAMCTWCVPVLACQPKEPFNALPALREVFSSQGYCLDIFHAADRNPNLASLQCKQRMPLLSGVFIARLAAHCATVFLTNVADKSSTPSTCRTNSSGSLCPMGSTRKSTPARRATFATGTKSVSPAIRMI